MKKKDDLIKLVSVIELIIAAVVIILDVFMPTLVILALIAISFLLRREKVSSLGFNKVNGPLRMVLCVFLLTVAWSVIEIGFILPVLNHITGTTQNLSDFEHLKGNFGQFIFLFIASWTLAAFGEEIVYRGFIQNRIYGLFNNAGMGVFFAVILSSVLFGLAHAEQGFIGIVITTLDAVFFTLLKYKYNSLWGSILAHGFTNTIGIAAFFFLGPIYGLW